MPVALAYLVLVVSAGLFCAVAGELRRVKAELFGDVVGHHGGYVLGNVQEHPRYRTVPSWVAPSKGTERWFPHCAGAGRAAAAR